MSWQAWATVAIIVLAMALEPSPGLDPTGGAASSIAEVTLYNIYDVTTPPAATPPAESNPFAIKLPTPVTPAPLATTTHVIKGVVFDVERCFEVRPVDQSLQQPRVEERIPGASAGGSSVFIIEPRADGEYEFRTLGGDPGRPLTLRLRARPSGS